MLKFYDDILNVAGEMVNGLDDENLKSTAVQKIASLKIPMGGGGDQDFFEKTKRLTALLQNLTSQKLYPPM